jgi:hypothetical protein
MKIDSIQEIVEMYVEGQPLTIYSEKYGMHVNNLVNTFITDEQTDIELMKLGFTIDRINIERSNTNTQIYLYTQINKQ